MTDNEENETIPWVPLENPCTRQAKDGVSLLVIGDTQDDHEAHRAAGIMLQRMTHEDPAIDLVLNLGDFVSWGGFLSEWRKYRQIASAYYSGQIPLVPVLGNHDGYGDPGAHNYSTLYATEPTAKRYYTLELAAAHLIVLNSNICTLSTADAASETAWLDHTLAILAGTKPIVVTYHHTGYTSSLGAIAMPCSPNYIRAHWVPLFGKYKVKLVLNGHDHFYERISVDGVEYLTVSAAAGHLAQPNIIHTKYSKKIISGHHTVTRVHIMGEGAFRVATWDSVSGTLLDDFSF